MAFICGDFSAAELAYDHRFTLFVFAFIVAVIIAVALV